MVEGGLIGWAIAANGFASSGSCQMRLGIEIGFFGSLTVAPVLVVMFLRRLRNGDRR